MENDYVYETTPYGIEEKAGKFRVMQMWTVRLISTHATRDEADEYFAIALDWERRQEITK